MNHKKTFAPNRYSKLFFIFAFFIFAPVRGAENPFVEDRDWAEKIRAQKFGEVPAIAIDLEDRIWVFQRGTPKLQIFSNIGDVVSADLPQNFKKPHQIRILDGHLWTVDQEAQVVQKFTLQIPPKHLLTLGLRDSAGAQIGQFDQPTDVALGPTGEIYVTDGYQNNRIQRFDPNGRFLSEWGRKGVRPGEFNLPHSIVGNAKGDLYVADRTNQRIQVFDAQGTFLREHRNLIPWSLWIGSDGEIWACGSSPIDPARLGLAERIVFESTGAIGIPPRDQIVLKFLPDGTLQGPWKFEGLRGVHGIAMDSHGSLFLSDIWGHRVHKYRRKYARPNDR